MDYYIENITNKCYLNEEFNCTETFPSVSISWFIIDHVDPYTSNFTKQSSLHS
jgi:hypothetical protein